MLTRLRALAANLDGPDLALAVARIVRPDADAYVRTDQQDVHTCWIDTGNGLAYEWRPDIGGAAFDEVLAFAFENIRMFGVATSRLLTSPGNAGTGKALFVASWVPDNEGGRCRSGSDHRIAVCRAIVAWGER